MYQRLYEHINKACCYITVVADGDVVSQGTGFAFLPTGEVLTAGHVVTGRMPLRERDYLAPNQQITCKFPGTPDIPYRVIICGISMRVPGFKADMQVDVAVLGKL